MARKMQDCGSQKRLAKRVDAYKMNNQTVFWNPYDFNRVI